MYNIMVLAIFHVSRGELGRRREKRRVSHSLNRKNAVGLSAARSYNTDTMISVTEHPNGIVQAEPPTRNASLTS